MPFGIIGGFMCRSYFFTSYMKWSLKASGIPHFFRRAFGLLSKNSISHLTMISCVTHPFSLHWYVSPPQSASFGRLFLFRITSCVISSHQLGLKESQLFSILHILSFDKYWFYSFSITFWVTVLKKDCNFICISTFSKLVLIFWHILMIWCCKTIYISNYFHVFWLTAYYKHQHVAANNTRCPQ